METSSPPNGFSFGQSNSFTHSMQCSGSLGVWAMVHRGKLTWGGYRSRVHSTHAVMVGIITLKSIMFC